MFNLKFINKVSPSLKKLIRNPNMFRSKDFWLRMDKAVNLASERLKAQVQQELITSNALATGFMRKSVRIHVEYLNNGFKLTVGTDAWYDVLVHEGLGPHSTQGSIPLKYAPTPAQLALLVPAWDSPERALYYKASPKKPRPFLRDALHKVNAKIMRIFGSSFMQKTVDYLWR